jgi:ActR/RegA family two-component response regulator
MELRTLLLCADEKIVRVLRRTLGGMEIEVEACASAETALRKLTRERFEAIIVDVAGEGAEAVLRSARLALCNKRAIAVAILDVDTGMRSMFDLGAHFILYKPVSAERAKSSFRAARALMKKERRRNARVTVNIPVEMSSVESGVHLKVNTIDLGEGGLAVNVPRRTKLSGRWQLKFTLPGSAAILKVEAEFAWEGAGGQMGLRFENQTAEVTRHLRGWLDTSSPQAEKDDPPVACQLTDLSLGGCYLETASPFPVSTRVTLSMRAAEMEMSTEGVVRVMHADRGMGVEFVQANGDQQAALEKFLRVLNENRDLLPELLVEPEGLQTEPTSAPPVAAAPAPTYDALLGLFREQAALPVEAFLQELRKQRTTVGTSA